MAFVLHGADKMRQTIEVTDEVTHTMAACLLPACLRGSELQLAPRPLQPRDAPRKVVVP